MDEQEKIVVTEKDFLSAVSVLLMNAEIERCFSACFGREDKCLSRK